jgi:hypothetical protein
MQITRYLLSALCALFTHTATAQNSPILLRVKATGGDSHDDIKNSTASVHHQRKELTATITNLSREEQKGLTIKWYAIGREMKGNRVVIFSNASNSMTLGPAKAGTDIFKAATTYTPDHSVVSSSRSRTSGKTRTSVKKVSGTGTKMLGWGVQVIRDAKVVAEEFQPPGQKASLSTAQTTGSSKKK